MQYHNAIRTGNNLTLSVDNVVLDLYISAPAARNRLMKLLETLPITHAVEVTHWNSFRPGSFREQFSIHFQDGNSFWIGAVLNGRKPEYGRVRLDFNPNKVAEHAAFQQLLRHVVSSTRPMHRTVKRFDLAIDFPVLRQDVFLVKDSRAYLERRHGSEFTQYLGAKASTVGRVKLYNKQTESNLGYPLTRLELTLNPATPYDEINFPVVYYLDDLQMCFDETIKATDTERFILNAILQGCGTLEQLGRKTREKIKRLMDGYVQYVKITEPDFNKVISQVNGYKTADITNASNPDQPPPNVYDLPDWVREAERAGK